MTWRSYEHGNDIHVMPLTFPEHDFRDCWCDPPMGAGDAGLVYHHQDEGDNE